MSWSSRGKQSFPYVDIDTRGIDGIPDIYPFPPHHPLARGHLTLYDMLYEKENIECVMLTFSGNYKVTIVVSDCLPP